MVSDSGAFVGPMLVGVVSHAFTLDTASCVVAASSASCGVWYAISGSESLSTGGMQRCKCPSPLDALGRTRRWARGKAHHSLDEVEASERAVDLCDVEVQHAVRDDDAPVAPEEGARNGRSWLGFGGRAAQGYERNRGKDMGSDV